MKSGELLNKPSQFRTVLFRTPSFESFSGIRAERFSPVELDCTDEPRRFGYLSRISFVEGVVYAHTVEAKLPTSTQSRRYTRFHLHDMFCDCSHGPERMGAGKP